MEDSKLLAKADSFTLGRIQIGGSTSVVRVLKDSQRYDAPWLVSASGYHLNRRGEWALFGYLDRRDEHLFATREAAVDAAMGVMGKRKQCVITYPREND